MDVHSLAAVLGAAAGLAGAYLHRRGRVRAWLPHLFMAAAMTAMALPEHDPLGPAGWMLLLGVGAAWALGRPGTRRGPGRAAAALDLYAMGVLTLLMPAVHGGGHAHHGGDADSTWWVPPYVALLAVWFAARLALATAEYRRYAAVPASGPRFDGCANPSVSSACSTAMITSMAVMAFAA